MNPLLNLWRRLGITIKLGIVYAVLLLLIVTVVAISNVTLALSNRETERALESVAIQQLVSEINAELQRARALEQNFYEQYPGIGVPQAREQYALPAVTTFAGIIQSSEDLRRLIDASDSVGEQLQASNVNLNLFLSSAERNSEIFLESVDTVSELAAPETGLEAQIDQTAETLLVILQASGDQNLVDEYYQMRLAEKDYLLTRQRPFFQTAFNQANLIRGEIASIFVESTTPDEINTLLDSYIAIGEEIIDKDIELQQTFSEFDLQEQTVNPIAEQLISLANEEVSNARAAILQTAALARNVLIVVAVVTLILTVLTAYLLHNSITRNILTLTATARDLEEGNLQSRASIASHDELGNLANTLNGMAEQLSTLINTLEERVAARTRDLEVAAEVSKEAVTVTEPEILLPRVANLTKDTFGLYHVSIFEYNEDTEILYLEYATGEAGEKMLADNLNFHIDTERSLVSKTARNREPVVVGNTAASDEFLPNPHLEATRSEVAFPMIVGDQLIGVLDMQSTEINRFSTDELRVFQTLADRIAISIRNAELFRDTRLAREQAEKADQAKSAFLASTSHELRTPLNAILNYSQFMARGKYGAVNDEQINRLNTIVKSGRYLLNMINDLLDMSKIAAGSLEIYTSEVDLNAEIEEVVRLADGLVADDVELVTEIEPNLPTLEGDGVRIRQIMINMVSNAAKFTQEGHVRLVAHREGNWFCFSVEDTGVGIKPADYESVFAAFQQTESGKLQGKGTGLGMPISKSLAEAHHGTLTFESTYGEGSTFHLKIPFEVADEPVPESVFSVNI